MSNMNELRNCWRTPRWLFNHINKEFKFTVDGAATSQNSLCKWYFEDAFNVSPKRERIWVNPPYRCHRNRIIKWVELAMEWQASGNTVYMLLLSDTGTKWFDLAFNNCTRMDFFTPRFNFDLPYGADFEDPKSVRAPSVGILFKPSKRKLKPKYQTVDLTPVLEAHMADEPPVWEGLDNRHRVRIGLPDWQNGGKG